MESLKGKKAIVTGGSRGLGLGIAEALVAQGAQVTVLARNAADLAQVTDRLGVATIQGDITDEALARKTIQEIQPDILVLNAGVIPALGAINELDWEGFNRVWDVDVKGTFHWLQAALQQPLAPGSRVLVMSSGAAINSSGLSGSYAGAKRMQWFMVEYAATAAKELGLGINFQAMLPMQIIGETELGQKASTAYARRKGVSVENMLANFGEPLPPLKLGGYVVSILTDAQYENWQAIALKGDKGIYQLEK